MLILVISMLCLFGCTRTVKPLEEHHTTYDGVYISVDDVVDAEDIGKIIKVTWHNEGDVLVTFGLGYSIEYLDNGEWKNVQLTDFAVIDIACMLDGGETATQDYATKHFNLIREGVYRIRTEFYVSGENGGSHSTWALFEVSQ